MTFTYDHIMNWPFEEVEHSYTVKDSTIYALGVGFAQDPMDMRQLPYVFEEMEFQAVPTMAAVLATPGFWARDPNTGIDWKKILHGEQGIVIHKPLPPAATLLATTRVTEVLDKGDGKGALIFTERDLVDNDTGVMYATLSGTSFARGNGGFGGPSGPQPQPHTLPDRKPDMSWDFTTRPEAALLYRLSGDYNPLHANPIVAESAGFKKPILHGLCSLGVAGHAILRTYCDYDNSRFKSLKLRFSSPVYPGETLRTEMWKDGDVISFCTKVVERDVVVLNNGRAEVSN
ncbi:MaoC family dehydratase [uncultured Shimia sp.]|uniref:MaoC family dehydratase n=1 Tax=uncultured Shimia sp. TaxID=573152 RepID=UPI0025FBA962|nr:MaoC family dehydratase [uncultured Shimia sp.]